MSGARKILLNSGRRSHNESLPLDGSRALPTEPIEPVDMSSSIEKDQEKPMAKNKGNAGIGDKIVQFLTPAVGWIAKRDVVHEFGLTPENAKYYLTQLLKAKRIQAQGATISRVYGSLALKADGAPATASTPKRRGKNKPTVRTSRAAATPAPQAAAVDCEDFTISNRGDLTITGGVRLNAPAVRRLSDFLDVTSELWQEPQP